MRDGKEISIFLFISTLLVFFINRKFVYLANKHSWNKQTIKRNRNCIVESVEDLLQFGRETKYPNEIPKIIHYVYKTNLIPKQYVELVKKCMEINSEEKFVFWSDLSVKELVWKYFPEKFPIYKTYLSRSIQQLKLSDINRYFILLKFGGIYMDLDTKCQKPFKVVMENDSCILSKEIEEQSRILWNAKYLAMNSLMACIPDHKFFTFLVEHIRHGTRRFNVLKLTGPFMLTKWFEAYNNELKTFDNPLEMVSLADAYTFSPYSEGLLESYCRKKLTEKWKILGCKTLQNHRKLQKVKEKEAVTVHLFMHLGYEANQQFTWHKKHICTVFVEMRYIDFVKSM